MDGEPPERATFATVELVVRAKAGDRAAVAEIYERHYERVRRAAAVQMGRALYRCEQDIEDVVHDAFADAIEALASGKFDEAKTEGGFRFWLSKVVVNKIRGRARKASTRREGLLYDLCDTAAAEARLRRSEPGPPTMAGDKEVFDALLALDEVDRKVITMRYLCRMSRAEVAHELGYARERQVSYAAGRAMDRLRRRLGVDADEVQGYFRAV